MSIRTTVTLDDDVFSRLKEASMSKGVPFRQMLNDAIRSGLLASTSNPSRQRFEVKPARLGVFPGVNLDNIAAAIEAAEGDAWR